MSCHSGIIESLNLSLSFKPNTYVLSPNKKIIVQDQRIDFDSDVVFFLSKRIKY